MILGLNGASNRYTFELIAITQVIASHVAMVVKHHLACRRPDRVSGLDLPMIETPGHGSFPSAHATEAFAVSELLRALVDTVSAKYSHFPDREKRKKLIDKQAERIAVNRTVAGVHFPIDSWAGAALGVVVARIILAKCGCAANGNVDGYEYIANDTDFRVKTLRDTSEATKNGLKSLNNAAQIDKSDLFCWLWQKSLAEFNL